MSQNFKDSLKKRQGLWKLVYKCRNIPETLKLDFLLLILNLWQEFYNDSFFRVVRK